MLWYKGWLETRIRLLIGLGADSGARRTGFRGERENDSGTKVNGIPG